MHGDLAVLFARKKSHYKDFDGLQVYDENRDARTFKGSCPVIAHPPCRAWGRLRQMSKHLMDEKSLALFAVQQVQQNGGILEHPAYSTLWPEAGLPHPGHVDGYGGFTLPINQAWFGHRAPKATWLYIVGVCANELPALPYDLGYPSGRVEYMGQAERERTPVDLAKWLISVAKLIGEKNAYSEGQQAN